MWNSKILLYDSIGDLVLVKQTHIIPLVALLHKPTVVNSDQVFKTLPLSQALAICMD